MCGANSGFPIRSGSHCFSIDSHGTFLRDLQRPAIHSSLLWAWQLGGKRLSFYLRSSPAYFLSHYFRICDLLLEIMQRPFRRQIRLNRITFWRLSKARIVYVSYRLISKSSIIPRSQLRNNNFRGFDRPQEELELLFTISKLLLAFKSAFNIEHFCLIAQGGCQASI
jgi:hypothetical protein